MKKFRNIIATIMMITSIVGSLSSFSTITYADSNSGVPSQTTINTGSIGKEIKFLGESTVTLKNVFLLPTDNGQIFYTSVEVHNKSNQPLDFKPYWVKMTALSGGKFPVTFINTTQNRKVLPGTKQTFSYYSVVPNELSLSDLSMKLMKWDFSMPNYERSIYSFTLPDQNIIPQVNTGESYVYMIQDIPVSINVDKVRVSNGNNSMTVKMNVSNLNQGIRSAKLPSFNYTLRSKDGYTYPVSVNATDVGATVLPQIKQTVELTVQLPSNSDVNNYSLVVSEPI
ncbi:MAG: hypothetical protein WD907_07830, partial [Bacilli bacterium]